MRTLERAGLSWLLRHPWQLSLALVGVSAGVAVMVAVDLATGSAARAFELSMDAVNGAATDHIVAGPAGVDERLYVRLRVREGLRNVAPVVEGTVETGDTALTLLGVDLLADRAFRDWTRPAAEGGRGRALVRKLLVEPGAVLLSKRTAKRLGLEEGGGFDVLAGGRVRRAMVAGLVGQADDPRLDDVLVADVATAQAWLDRPGRLTRIDVRLDGGGERGALETLLPEGVRLLPAEARTEAVRDMTRAFMTNLTAMSLLAMLVGVFLIYNSVSFAVLQRRGLLGILRALGVTRRETFALILFEAALLGAAGSVIGLGGGVWLGERLLGLVSRSINDLYFVSNVTGVSVGVSTMVKAAAAGFGATVTAASVPALEAARVPPRLALARSGIEGRGRALLPAVTAGGLFLIAAAALLLWLSGRNLVAGLASLFVLLLGCALLIPLAVRAVSALAAPVAGAWGGVAARHAIAGVPASLSRSGVAVAALAVAISATVGVTVMVDSFRAAVGAWVGRSLQADLYVGVGRGTLDPVLARALAAVEGIAAHSTTRRVILETADARTRVTVLDLPPPARSGTELLEGDPDEAWAAFETRGAVFVSAPYAYRHGIGAGDTVSLPTARGMQPFAVAAVYRSYDAALDSLLMSRRTYDAHWDDPSVDSLALYLAADGAADRVVARLRETAAGRQALLVRSNRELRDATLEIFDRTFVITDVLYWLALGVAAVGILGALLAMQIERAREYAVLRALGMTPRQLGGVVVGQAAYIGLLSGLAALPLGIAMAWVLIEVINRRAFGWQMAMDVSPSVPASAVGLAVAAAVIAGLYPGWRAARAVPALAMREE